MPIIIAAALLFVAANVLSTSLVLKLSISTAMCFFVEMSLPLISMYVTELLSATSLAVSSGRHSSACLRARERTSSCRSPCWLVSDARRCTDLLRAAASRSGERGARRAKGWARAAALVQSLRRLVDASYAIDVKRTRNGIASQALRQQHAVDELLCIEYAELE
ncbi:hypothetical protein [Caballeronia grimmiae]|uniref:hypothetical protein n=1 Tax=Caballeronia grimmiae TaxID=1071679 RepID=UPI0038B94B35